MAYQITVRGGRTGGPVPDPVSEDFGVNGATVTNLSTTHAIYYGDESFSDTALANGSIAAGSSATLYGQQYFMVASSSPVVRVVLGVDLLLPSLSAGSGSGVADGLVPAVDHRVRPPQLALSNGTDTGANYSFRHKAIVTCRGVRVAYTNYYNVGGDETDGPNAITVRAGLMTSDGQAVPLYFNGQRDVIIGPGATVWSDPAGGFDLKRGDSFDSRTNVTVTSGQKWPLVMHMNGFGSTLDRAESGTSITDKTLSGTIPQTSADGYGPTAIHGLPKNSALDVLGICGDSIASGVGEGSLSYDYSWIARGLAEKYALQFASWSGDGATRWRNNALVKHSRRTHLLNRCTHILCTHGTNDLSNGVAITQQAQIETWQHLASKGAKVYQTTIIPRTTSTDGWTTLANQTVTATEAARLAVNAWIRDGCPIDSTALTALAVGASSNVLRAGQAGHPLSGWFEVADSIESARDSGKFRVDLGRTVADINTTASSTTATSATANFTAADAGTYIAIPGAGAAGALKVTTINVVTNSTTITLGSSAGTTVAGGPATIGIPTNDGTHPSTTAERSMAAAAAPIAALLRTAS